jgi:hypothetical protein
MLSTLGQSPTRQEPHEKNAPGFRLSQVEEKQTMKIRFLPATAATLAESGSSKAANSGTTALCCHFAVPDNFPALRWRDGIRAAGDGRGHVTSLERRDTRQID